MTRLSWITVATGLLMIAPLSLAAPKEIIDQEPMVIVNNHESHFIDAVGKPLPKPVIPAPLASPVNLLNPDKYEFYTFDDKGDLIKRLMTMEEIQSIVANGDSEGAMFLPNTQDKESEADIQGILENIQDVLSKEIEKNSNDSNNHFLDTPDVSSNWNLILPAIFGNTGDPIVPQSKPPSYSMTPESDIIVETTTKKTYKKPKPTKAPTTPKPVTVPKIVTTPKPVTTPATAKPTPVVYKTTPGKISSVVYPSKIKKPASPSSPPRPYQTPVELKNNFPLEIDEPVVAITKPPIPSPVTSFKTTKKPFASTIADSVKIVSTSTKFRPTGTTTFYSTRFTARPSTLIVTEPATTKRIETTPTTTTTTTTTTPKPTTTTTERTTTTTERTTTTTTTTPKPTTTTTERTTTTTTTTPRTTTTTTTTTTPRPTTTTTTTTTTTPKPTTTPEPTTTSTTTTTTTEAPKVEEEMIVEDPLHQIIQTLNESPSISATPMPTAVPTQKPIATERIPTTTEEDVEVATKIYRPLEYLIPVDIHPEDVLVKIAQNFGIGDQNSEDGTTVSPSLQTNVEHKPNKVFTNSELYVDEEEPEVHENPTTVSTTKWTTPYPIYNRPNGIAQKVDEYIASQSATEDQSSLEDSVAVDTMALPFMSQKVNGFVANYAQMLKENSPSTTLAPEMLKDGIESEATTSGYSMLEESLSGILDQVSDSRPHSVPLVEDHRIESKIKDIENPEELTIDEELDKLSDPTDDDNEEEEEEEMLTTTTEKVFEKIEVISKNELPPLEESVAKPQEDKFEELESLSLIVDALSDKPENDLKEDEAKEAEETVPTTTEIPVTTPITQKVTFVTSIVKETHSVSVHQEKPTIVKEVDNFLDADSEEADKENVETKSEELIEDSPEIPMEELKEESVEEAPEEEESNLDTEADKIETIKEDEEEEEEINTENKESSPTTTEESPLSTTAQEEIVVEEEKSVPEEAPIEKITFEEEKPVVPSIETTTTTKAISTSSEEFPEDLQVENLTLDSELITTTMNPPTTTASSNPESIVEEETAEKVQENQPQPTTTESTIEIITEGQIIADVPSEKTLPEVLRKSDFEEATEMLQDETFAPTTTEIPTSTSGDMKDEETYERLGETTTAESDMEAIYSTLGETTTLEPEEPTTVTEPPPPSTTAAKIIPESTTAAEEIITKAETQYKPTKVRFQPSTGGYRPTGAFKRPSGSVFHVKNKPAIRVEQRNPTRSPLPVRLQSAPKDSLGLEQSTVNLDPDYMDFTRLCNELAFSYWTTLQTDGVSSSRSVILSPFGITSMLSMVFLGARGATSGEMNEILKLDDMITFNPHLVFRNVTDSIENLRENGVYTSALVRELFSDRSKGKLLPFYKEKSQQYYAGYVEEANFNLINDIVRRRTNLLIKRHTWGKIMEYLRTNNLVLKGPLAAVTATVFQTDCSKASVADRDGEMFFQMEPEVKQRKLVPIPSVVIKSGFTAGYDPELDATLVGLGNGNNIVSTLLLMPGQQGTNAPGDNIERLEEAFMAKPVDNWHRLLTTLMERQELEVQIPKFTHRSFINGTTLMQRMGLKELFDSSKSDLRGLTANANQDMYLADLLQINTFSTCGEDKIPDSHYKEVYPSPPSQKQLNYARLRKLSKKMHNPYLSTLPENILSRMHLTADQVAEANEETVKYVEYQRALFDPFYDTKYMELPLPLRPRQARIPDSPRLKFDKPFLYFVRHNPTGMILYMGRFNPKLN